MISKSFEFWIVTIYWRISFLCPIKIQKEFMKTIFIETIFRSLTGKMWSRLLTSKVRPLIPSIKRCQSSTQYYPINDDILGLTDDQKQVRQSRKKTFFDSINFEFFSPSSAATNGFCFCSKRTCSVRQWNRSTEFIFSATRSFQPKDQICSKDFKSFFLRFLFKPFWKKMGDLGLLGITAPGSNFNWIFFLFISAHIETFDFCLSHR